MDKEYNWLELKPIPTEFIENCLNNDMSISNNVLNNMDKIKFNKVYSLLPINIPEAKTFQFNYGGIWDLTERNSELIKYLDTLQYDYTIIFENWMVQRSDPCINKFTFPYFTFGEEIYYFFIKGKHKIEILREELIQADNYPFIAYILTKMELSESEISESEIKNIIPKLKQIIIGAYDEESFIRVELENQLLFL